jgi:hypothetical protein
MKYTIRQTLQRTLAAALTLQLVYAPSLSAQAAPVAPKTPAAAYPGYTAPQPDITEQEISNRLVGKQLYLRGLWLDDDLSFNGRGEFTGHSPTGSFTLCAVEIQRVRLTKNAVELEGIRYGIHFLGETPWPEQSTSFDRIRLTPKKKVIKITIDRPLVVLPKETPEEKAARTQQEKVDKQKGAPGVYGSAADAAAAAEAAAHPPAPPLPPPPPPPPAPKTAASEPAAPATGPVTVSSYGEASAMLRSALDRVFAPSIDAQMIAAMPDYWQYFYQAQRDHKSIEPTDASILHAGPGVDGPRIVHTVVPVSNDYAQANEIAGVAIYKLILGPDGKPMAVAVYRPIGFGLDENAVDAIRKSTYSAASKDGKTATSVINLTISFRIYSSRTLGHPAPEEKDTPPAQPR